MRRGPVIFVVAIFLAVGVCFLSANASGSFFPTERTSELVYRAFIDRYPEGAQSVRISIPLASSRDGQTILEREIDAPVPYRITTDPVYGNEMAYFDLRGPLSGPQEFEVRYRARISEEDSRRAARRGDTVRACLLGKGNCTDFHSLFISMAHAAEIPARFKIGFTIPEAPEGEIAGYHCWAEFFDETRGWYPVDASEAWKHPDLKEVYFGGFDTHKFLVSVGRDIELAPRQSGPPVNIFFYPYIEVDGKEWQGAETSFRYKNES